MSQAIIYLAANGLVLRKILHDPVHCHLNAMAELGLLHTGCLQDPGELDGSQRDQGYEGQYQD